MNKKSSLHISFLCSTGQHDGLLLGDSGYPCRPCLMTPILNPSTPPEARFNRSLCRTRVVIEQTFGVFKQRFPCLRIGLRVKPLMAVAISGACAVLHNIGIARGDIIDFVYEFNDAEVAALDAGFAVPADANGAAVRQQICQDCFYIGVFVCLYVFCWDM